MNDFEDFWDEDDPVTAEELAEAIRGDLGVAAQAQAAEVLGVELFDAEASAANSQYANEFTAQAIRKERDLGRPLTQKEVHDLAVDQAGTGPPDLDEAYERINGRKLSDDEDRRQIAVEYMQDANAAQDAGEIGEDEGAEAA